MSLTELLASLKTFTWSFSVGYKPAMITVHALDEDGARKIVLDLLSDIAEKNKEYVPLKKQWYGNINRLSEMWKKKMDLENEIRGAMSCLKEIERLETEQSDLDDEMFERLEETTYLAAGKYFDNKKANLTKTLEHFHKRLKTYDPLEQMQKKVESLQTEYAFLERKGKELESKLEQIKESIKTNDLTGPYTISLIELTLDFETGSGETLREILEQTPQMKQFCATTIFSALDG